MTAGDTEPNPRVQGPQTGMGGVYWFQNLPAQPEMPEQPLRCVDVAIVGSGYTGLNAALVTARAGRSTMVLDAQNPGWGCSTRNGGQISTSIKPDLKKLTSRYGVEKPKPSDKKALMR